MKISYRILLINFVIVAVVFVSSTIAFFSLTKKLISIQHSRSLQYSANDLVSAYSNIISEADYDFIKFYNLQKGKNGGNIGKPGLINDDLGTDFILKVNSDLQIIKTASFVKESLQIDSLYTLAEFVKYYPDVAIKKYIDSDGLPVYYGVVISETVLNSLSKKIRAQIALLLHNVPVVTSNEKANRIYSLNLLNISKIVNKKDRPDIFVDENENADLYATIFQPGETGLASNDIKFLIFSPLPEASELRRNMTVILIIIGVAGVALSLIFTLLVTSRLRRQITNLARAAMNAKSGNLKYRVGIVSNDELGNLGSAFNRMMDELERNEKTRSEYTEFLALIHKNPTLKEISEAALAKIIQDTGMNAGLLSVVEDGEIRNVASNGISGDKLANCDNDLYQKAVKSAEIVELRFSENFPVISSGLLSLDIRYLLIYPIVYNKKVIAILELAGINECQNDCKKYLSNIHDQLAIGITNSTAFLNLEKQKEKAEESAVLKSQFLANMSHELRTPLVSILGLSDLIIKDRYTTEDSRRKLNVVRRNGNRLLRLINDILDFSKIEAGKMELRPEPFYINELLQRIEEFIIPVVADKNGPDGDLIRYICENNTPEKLVVKADKSKMIHVLLNLLGNAVKFTEKGIVKISADFLESNKIEFKIADSGIGISEKDKEIIFEEFRQIDGTSSKKYYGSGLGLAISRKTAELMNGTLECHSSPGAGSVFVFTLPVEIVSEDEVTTDETGLAPLEGEEILDTEAFEYVESDAKEIDKNKNPENADKAKKNKARLDGKRGGIIVVENNKVVQETISDYLTGKKFDVSVLQSPADLFGCINESRPGFVIMNMSVPGLESWKVLIELKENVLTRDIPVIPFITLEDLNIGYVLNIYDIIIKQEISGRISQVIKKISSRESIKEALVIDLDETVIPERLKERNIDIAHYSDCTDALKHAVRKKPDIIISDFVMPKIDGITFTHKIKRSFDTRNIPVVLVLDKNISENELLTLNDSLERAALRANESPIDMLRTIRDRLNVDEEVIIEDITEVWSDSEEDTGSENQEIKSAPKILIVDDDPDILYTVGEIVRTGGYETVFAKNGLECLTSLQKSRPDLILLDIMMPVMDGFQTIKRIRADKKLSDIPVFALTAIAMSEENQVVIRSGFDDYIPKPVDSSILTFKIKKIIADGPKF